MSDAHPPLIIRTDAKRDQRIPPRQALTHKWHVLHAGTVPDFDWTRWTFMVHCEHGFTTNLPLADFLGDDCLLAWKHDGNDLEPDHGFSLRLIVPLLYAWNSANWVRGIELMAGDRPGFWES
jgi:DMSO/TMAO reductase YedYZ molybdopterin-dependent catalytic subunit